MEKFKNLTVATSKYKSWDKEKSSFTNIWTLLQGHHDGTGAIKYSIKLNDWMTNILRSALWQDFNWWINCFDVDEDKKKTVDEKIAEENQDPLPF